MLNDRKNVGPLNLVIMVRADIFDEKYIIFMVKGLQATTW